MFVAVCAFLWTRAIELLARGFDVLRASRRKGKCLALYVQGLQMEPCWLISRSAKRFIYLCCHIRDLFYSAFVFVILIDVHPLLGPVSVDLEDIFSYTFSDTSLLAHILHPGKLALVFDMYIAHFFCQPLLFDHYREDWICHLVPSAEVRNREQVLYP